MASNTLHRSYAAPDARTILRLNAIASAAAGVVMLIFAGPLARLSGVVHPAVLAVCGAIALAYGLDELSVAVGRRLRRAEVRIYALADVALTAGGLAFLVRGPETLTFLERSLIAVTVGALGWFACAGFRAAKAL